VALGLKQFQIKEMKFRWNTGFFLFILHGKRPVWDFLILLFILERKIVL
jgi:hypothetical protein